MTSTSERGLLDPASPVVLRGDARPMIHGDGEPIVAGLSPHDDAALARALGNRRDSYQADDSPGEEPEFCAARNARSSPSTRPAKPSSAWPTASRCARS